jgi:hypothetical protein
MESHTAAREVCYPHFANLPVQGVGSLWPLLPLPAITSTGKNIKDRRECGAGVGEMRFIHPSPPH